MTRKTIHEIMQEGQQQSASQCYDVLDNERHKAVSKLREIPDCELAESVRAGRLEFTQFFYSIANAIGIREHITFATVRDRLIYLIGGDKEEGDGLADSVHDSGECMGVRVDGCESDSGMAVGLVELPIATTLPSFETITMEQDGTVVTIASDGTIKTSGDAAKAEPDAIAEYHRMLRRMLGDVKGVHDKLVAQAEPYARLKHEYARLKHECHMYRAMLNDAAKEYQETCDKLTDEAVGYKIAMVGYRERAAALEDSERLRHELEKERDAYMQNYHDVLHGNEINAEWFDRRGFIELPKGKDGRHIRMGETVRWGDVGEPFEVRAICYYPDGDVRVSDDGVDVSVSACLCNHVDDDPNPVTSAFDKYDAGLLTRDELVAALRQAS